MQRYLKLFALLPVALAVYLPQDESRGAVEVVELNKAPWVYEIDQENAQTSFAVPFKGRLNNAATSVNDEYLIFEFQALAQKAACDLLNATINGDYLDLPRTRNGNSAQGYGSFPMLSRPGDLDSSVTVSGSWESTCLFNFRPGTVELDDNGVAQIFSLTIDRINEQPVEENLGFTVSYRQNPKAELLRLSGHPTALDGPLGVSWQNPPPEERLAISCPDEQESTSLIESKMEELLRLQAQSEELNALIQHKKEEIRLYVQNTFHSEGAMNECSNVTCTLKALLETARGTARSVYRKMHRHSRRQVEEADWLGAHNPASLSEPGSHQAFVSAPSSPPTKPSQAQCQGVWPPPSRDHPSLGSTRKGSVVLPDDLMPSIDAVDPFLLSLKIFAVVVTAIGLTMFLHRSCSLRRRTERRASREERRAARAYRRAARCQRWRNWWNGVRRDRPQPPTNYEEKRLLVEDQEVVLERAMQEELRLLRDAHHTVHSMVQGNSTESSNSRYHDASVGLGRTNSLPDYRSDAGSTEPPAYETDEDTSDFVVDGFSQYTPSSTTMSAERRSEQSSVIDVSPRPSAETSRYSQDYV